MKLVGGGEGGDDDADVLFETGPESHERDVPWRVACVNSDTAYLGFFKVGWLGKKRRAVLTGEILVDKVDVQSSENGACRGASLAICQSRSVLNLGRFARLTRGLVLVGRKSISSG